MSACRPCRRLAALVVSLDLFQATAMAGEDAAREGHAVLQQVDIIGDPSEIYTIPGSAHYLDERAIREFSYDDIDRVLRRVPGVYVREEDGYGLFPNISLRGVDTTRSAKVTMMEDGVLAAPAPYAAPAAYYSPTTGRMHAIEVLKGTSQVRYGPHTTGGAINYLATPIPYERDTYLRGQYGADNEYRTHAYHGDTIETGAGRFGYLFEGFLRGTDGFKTIDAAPGFNDTDETGFQTIEPMVRLAWEPTSAIYQRLEFKYGYTDEEADETYLGLSTEDFRRDPFRRYSASRFDHIDTEQHRTYLRHFISPTGDFDLVTTAYYNKFARNWYKLNDIRAAPGGLGTNLGLSSALAGAEGGDGLACLRGELACNLRVRANDRSYYAWGIQSEGTLRFATGPLDHALSVGLRYHTDEEDRFQNDDVYSQAANGAITDVARGAPGSQDNRESEVRAVALFVEDRIQWGQWWMMPGFRYETLELEQRDYRPLATGGAAVYGEESLDMLGGGAAVGYNLTDGWQVFGGVNFGFSPPSPGAAINDGLTEETSVGYELGTRYASDNRILVAEAVGFLTQFEDLIVVSNIGGTGTGEDENFGEVDAYGLELSGQFDLGAASGWSFSNLYWLAFTYTIAEQQNDAQSTDPESIFSFGAEGNKVPYIPEYQLTIGSSLTFARWGAALSASFVDETYTSASNVETEVDGLGNPDARFGTTDAYTVVDLSANYELTEAATLLAGVHNLLEEEYIVSRQPHGPRPGIDRTWYVGVEIDL